MKKPKKKRSGPREPVSGLLSDRLKAQEEKCTDHPALLAGLRDGSISSEMAYAQLRYLIYNALPERQRAADEIIGYYAEALLNCINRLRKNEVTNVEKFIQDEFWRGKQDKRHHDFDGIAPDYRDKAAAERHGIKPEDLTTMYRVDAEPAVDDDGDEGDSVLDTGATPPPKTKLGEEYVTPSRLKGQSPPDTDHIAYTPLECSILAMLLQGHAVRVIAESESLTEYQVDKIIRRFRERAIRDGMLPAEKERLAG